MLQEEKQRVNYLLSLFLPENQVSKNRISAAEISPHYIKNFRLKLFIKMFVCPLKDMITVQFLILTLSVLLKYRRYGYFITNKRTFVRLIRKNPLFSFRAQNKYSLCWNHYLHFMMIHSLGIQKQLLQTVELRSSFWTMFVNPQTKQDIRIYSKLKLLVTLIWFRPVHR